MQRIYLLLIVSSFLSKAYAQRYFPLIADKVTLVSDIQDKLIAYENFGPKVTASRTLDSVNSWLVEYYTSLGYTVSLDSFLSGTATNIIIEKLGQDTSTWLIVGAHYDSVKESYGANDNGSGVVATMEIARIIADIPTRRSVRLINFSGEEQGLLGSKHYVANTLNPNDNVQLMLNLDQLGGAKFADNSKIVCERDEGNSTTRNDVLSLLKTDTLATIINQYTSLEPVFGPAFSTDYMPFEDSGYTITGLYQESDYSRFYHSSADRVFNMDTEATEQVIKGALAATLYFAGIDLLVGMESLENSSVIIYPSPTSNIFRVDGLQGRNMIMITNSLGQIVLKTNVNNSDPIDVSLLSNGLYTVSIYTQEDKYIASAKLIIAR